MVGAYYLLWDITVKFIYGNPEVLTSDQELVLTAFCTFGSYMVLSLPLVAVLWFVKRFM